MYYQLSWHSHFGLRGFVWDNRSYSSRRTRGLNAGNSTLDLPFFVFTHFFDAWGLDVFGDLSDVFGDLSDGFGDLSNIFGGLSAANEGSTGTLWLCRCPADSVISLSRSRDIVGFKLPEINVARCGFGGVSFLGFLLHFFNLSFSLFVLMSSSGSTARSVF